VQTITSSIEFITGSTRNGSIAGNTHQFTGSMLVSGSMIVGGASTFSGSVTSTGTIVAGLTNGNIRIKGSTDGFLGSGESDNKLYLTDWATGAKGLTILLSTGAATFSSTVTTGDVLYVGAGGGGGGTWTWGTTEAYIHSPTSKNLNLTTDGGLTKGLRITTSGAATFSSTVTATGNINANNIKTFSHNLQGTGTPVSTGLSINAGGGGRTYLLLTSQQWDAGNSTSSAITMIRCGYDGNNFTAVVLSSSNPQPETWSQSGGILYVAGNTNFQLNITVLNNN
jgi:hypothetical protein